MKSTWSGEMAQQLRELTVVPKEHMNKHWLFFQRTQVQVPVPTQQLTSVCEASPRGSDACVASTGARHTCRQNTHIHKNK